MLILVDQDGVLADFDAAFTTRMRDAYPGAPAVDATTRDVWKVRDCYPPDWAGPVDAVPRAPGFFAGLPPVDGARQALEEMRAAGHDVFICTSPLSDYENCVLEKHTWVEQHLGRDWVRRVILTKDKTLVRGDVLIDDKPAVTGLLTPAWTHVVFDRSYNRTSPGPRLPSWSAWADVLAGVTSGQLAAAGR